MPEARSGARTASRGPFPRRPEGCPPIFRRSALGRLPAQRYFRHERSAFPLPCPVFWIMSDATGVARCARQSAEIAAVSSSSRPAVVPSVPDEAPAGLEELLLEIRQGLARDGEGQNQPAQEIAEIVGDDAEQQAHLVRPKPMTGEPSPVGGGFALLDPLPRRGEAAVLHRHGDGLMAKCFLDLF